MAPLYRLYHLVSALAPKSPFWGLRRTSTPVAVTPPPTPRVCQCMYIYGRQHVHVAKLQRQIVNYEKTHGPSRHGIIFLSFKQYNTISTDVRIRANPCQSVRIRANPCESVRIRANPCYSWGLVGSVGKILIIKTGGQTSVLPDNLSQPSSLSSWFY